MQQISLKTIALIIYDFDGVMTDNKVLVDESGKESVFCNRSDGLAIEKIKKLNIPQIIISSEVKPIVKTRADKLNIPCIYKIGIENKKSVVTKYCAKNKIQLNQTIYIGNDINDLEVMKTVAYPIAPSDAAEEVKNIACLITKAKGGEGVIRELLNLINFKQ